jgi:pimeloyl-ACP methyl ester carboxylesterase
MPHVTNRGVRIHYETIGNGPALVMHHGTFGSSADFIDLGYVDAFKANHQVILPDSRGHGQSDKPHDSNCYDLALRSSDVLAVLDELGVRKIDYFGYSLGGWIGFDLAIHAPERFGSFIFVGSHPYAENMQPFRDLTRSVCGDDRSGLWQSPFVGNADAFARQRPRCLARIDSESRVQRGRAAVYDHALPALRRRT